jgi:glc operon protein GlcG
MSAAIRYSLSLALLSGTLARAAEPAPITDTKSLTLEGAKRVASAAAAEARSHNEGGAIAVVDDGGNLLYLERIDGTFPAGAMISIGKARTAALFRKPTSAFEDVINNGRTAMVALPDFTPLQGGIPLEVDGRVVGAIGVSGASSQQRDEAVAKAGAASLR